MKPSNESPDAAEFGLLRAHLAGQGMSQADINSVIGTNVGGQSRDDIVNKLKAYFKAAPKGA